MGGWVGDIFRNMLEATNIRVLLLSQRMSPGRGGHHSKEERNYILEGTHPSKDKQIPSCAKDSLLGDRGPNSDQVSLGKNTSAFVVGVQYSVICLHGVKFVDITCYHVTDSAEKKSVVMIYWQQ